MSTITSSEESSHVRDRLLRNGVMTLAVAAIAARACNVGCKPRNLAKSATKRSVIQRGRVIAEIPALTGLLTASDRSWKE